MRDRFQDIEKFLKNIADKVKADDKDIEKMDIYHELANYGLNDEETKSEGTLRETQDKLYKDFRHRAFSDCWKTKDKYWLVFREESIDDMIRAGTLQNREQIKLYIPATEDNMYEMANGLFDFLDKNYIVNSTKMSADVRADDLVVRVFSQEDASSISKYINENFSDKIIPTNPFMINDGQVGIASDGQISYNERVAGFLADYFNDIKSKEQLENVSLRSFKEYMEKMREEIYSDETVMKGFLQKKDENYNSTTDSKYLYDNRNIMDLIIIALDAEKGIEDFNKHWEEINTSEKKKSTKDSINEILNSKNKSNNEAKVEKSKKTEGKTVTYDENGFDKVGRHKVTKSLYDEEGYNRKGYDREGYDREGYDKDGLDKEGFNKNGFNKYGKHRVTKGYYDEEGYNKEGYDKEGYNKEGVNSRYFNREGINIITNTKYDIDGYDRNGYDRHGFNKKGYNKDGIDRRGFNGNGIYQNTKGYYDEEGYDKDGYDKDGYNKKGVDRNNFNKKGINLITGTKYDNQGYDKDGFNKDGIDRRNFNKKGINLWTGTKYDNQGYDRRGFDKKGIFNIVTNSRYDVKGFDKRRI